MSSQLDGPGTKELKKRPVRFWIIDGLRYHNQGFPHGPVQTGESWRNATTDVPSQGGDASNLRP